MHERACSGSSEIEEGTGHPKALNRNCAAFGASWTDAFACAFVSALGFGTITSWAGTSSATMGRSFFSVIGCMRGVSPHTGLAQVWHELTDSATPLRRVIPQ